MQAVLKESKQFNHLLEWCLVASLLIHALIMFTMPKPDYDLPPPKKQEIRIELVKEQPPAPVQPAAEPEPTPPKPLPEPPKPQPAPVKHEPKPIKPEPVPQKPSPEPVVEMPRPVIESPAPPVIAAKPTVSETKPEVVVPPPAPPAPPPEPVKTGPSEGDIDAARNAFKEAAQREIQKNLRYPRIALDRGIEGVTNLHITFDDHGNITGIEITESSGNKALDEAAIATIKKSQFKALFNDILRGRLKSTNVPVSFKLAS